MDLPGYGRSEGKVDVALRKGFMEGMIAKLELNRPIVVSPSMSGQFTVPLVLQRPELLSGYVPVAAVKMGELENFNWLKAKILTLFMCAYGMTPPAAAASHRTHGRNNRERCCS